MSIPNLNMLELDVHRWAEEKGIYANATPLSQFGKTLEEVEELGDAIFLCDHDEIEDGIGDTIVTLIIQAHMQGTSIHHCLQRAYDVISKRTGKMVDGVFVKDE